MCQAYEAERNLVLFMEAQARNSKIEQEGYDAHWHNVPRVANPYVPTWQVQRMGLERATVEALKCSWDGPHIRAWWDGWDDASRERRDKQEPAGDLPLLR